MSTRSNKLQSIFCLPILDIYILALLYYFVISQHNLYGKGKKAAALSIRFLYYKIQECLLTHQNYKPSDLVPTEEDNYKKP